MWFFFAYIIFKNKLSSAVVMLNDLGDHCTLPLNFSMRDYVTYQVYATPPTNLLNLYIVLKILAIVRYLLFWEMCIHSNSRIQMCIFNNGELFEHWYFITINKFFFFVLCYQNLLSCVRIYANNCAYFFLILDIFPMFTHKMESIHFRNIWVPRRWLILSIWTKCRFVLINYWS